MKSLIMVIGGILLGIALFALIMSGDDSLYGVSKKGMQKSIEYLYQIP